MPSNEKGRPPIPAAPESPSLEEGAQRWPVRREEVEGLAEGLRSRLEERNAGIVHARVATRSCVTPPPNESRRASVNPASRSIDSSSLAAGRYAVDRGRYEYASRIREQPADRGHDLPEVHAVAEPHQPTVRFGRLEQRRSGLPVATPWRARRRGRQVRRRCAARSRTSLRRRSRRGRAGGGCPLPPAARGSERRAASRGRSRTRTGDVRPRRARGRDPRSRRRGRTRVSPAAVRAPAPSGAATRRPSRTSSRGSRGRSEG